MKKIIFILVLIFLIPQSSFSLGVDGIIKERLGRQDIIDTVSGILVYLDDNQVRNRPGKRMSVYDASDAGEGCRGKIELNLPLLQKTLRIPALPPLKVRNVEGEWTSTVHFIPKKIGRKGKSIVAIPDSNLFVPSFVIYPFFLFREDSKIPVAERNICNMLKYSWRLDERYKRGKAYNFWLPLVSDKNSTGPYNIPVDTAVMPLAKAYLNPKLRRFWEKTTKGLNVPTPSWVRECLDPVKNPSGASALFNIPCDSDDSSTAISLQFIRRQLKNAYMDDPFFTDENNFHVDLEAFEEIMKYRDLNREDRFEDGRDTWKGKNSGAFLTWLLDETQPTFSNTEKGVIPLGKNNVDSVVNSNVLLSMGLLKKHRDGYKETVAVLNKAIMNKTWPASGLYYPQFMIFPYTVTRSYRDGENHGLKPGMVFLLKELINIQKDFAKKFPQFYGAFPGGEDRTLYTSTALGITSLLNIGLETAIEEGVELEYKRAIKSAIDFLLATRKKAKIRNGETFNAASGKKKIHGYRWDSGLFFSASFWDLAHWRSDAFCNAMVLEAFSKYLLAYEYGGVTIKKGRRIHIMKYPENMKSGVDFKIQIK